MWLLAPLGALLLLVVLVLAVPLTVHFQLEREVRLKWRMRLDWFFGWLKIELRRSQADKRPREEVPSQKRPKRKPARKLRSILVVARNRSFLEGLAKFLRRLWRGLVWLNWSFDLRFGCSDPAATGIAWGLIGAPLSYTGLSPSRLSIQPDFSEERLQFSLNGAIRVTPLWLAATLLALLLRPATLRALVAFARAQKSTL